MNHSRLSHAGASRLARLRTHCYLAVLLLAVVQSACVSQPTQVASPTPVPLVVYGETVYELDGEVAKAVGKTGNDPFLAPSGMVSSIREGGTIQIHRYEGAGRLSLAREIALPTRVVATVEGSLDRIILKESMVKTTALAGGVLYLTGQMGDHTLGFLDLDLSDPPFKPMRVPKEVGGKPFDDLLVDGGSLLAVDNIETPKWLVIYDISRPKAPRLVKAVELPSGVYKGCHRGAVGPRYLALWCSEFGKFGDSDYVELHDKAEGFAHIGGVALWDRYLPKVLPGENAVWREEGFPVQDLEMSFLGELLLLSPYGDGVGVADCSHVLDDPRLTVDQLLYTGPDGKAEDVRAAVALAAGDRAVIWLEDGGDRGLVVSPASLSSRPYTQ